MFGPLIIGWFLSFGYVPQQEECLNGEIVSISSRDRATVAEIGLSAEYEPFKIYGSIESYQFFSGRYIFYPYRSDYKIGIDLKIAKGIRFIAEHECDHPVVSNMSEMPKYGYLSQSTRVVIKLEGSTR